MENLDILWVVFTLHKFSHLWQMIYSVFVVRFSYIPLKRKRIGLAGSFWRERDCSYPGSIRAYFRGSSPVSEKEGWRDGAGGEMLQAEVQGDTAKLQRIDRNGFTTWAVGEFNLSSWGGGDYAELGADQKAVELLEWNEAWKQGISGQGEFHKPPFVSILPCLILF